VATKPLNWKNLAQVIQYAEALARETRIQRTVYCINGQPHYAICERGKLPPDFTKIGKLIIHKDARKKYSEVFTTKV